MFSVYKIVNSINNKVYIGITSKSILARFKTHIKASRYSTRFNKICNALKKYGAENFSVVLVDHAHSWEEVCEKERRYIKEYDSMNNGYNLTIGGEGSYGMKHSDKTKALWSAQRKGKLNGMWGRISPMRGKKQLTSGTKFGLINPIGKIQGAWQLIYDTTVGSTVTSVTIPSLDGNTDVLYEVRARIVDANAVSCNLSFNSDVTNYGRQYLGATGSTIVAGRGAARTGFDLSNSNQIGNLSWASCLIYAKSGFSRVGLCTMTPRNAYNKTNQFANLFGQAWSNTTDNITQMVITGDDVSGIAAGSVIELWRLNL